MNCPLCNTTDFYVGVFGANCVNPSCAHYRNSGAPDASNEKAPREFALGDRVKVHRGPGWTGAPDNYWFTGTVIEVDYNGLVVRVDSGFEYPDGATMDDVTWATYKVDAEHIE